MLILKICHSPSGHMTSQTWGFAPIGILEFWNTGIMVPGKMGSWVIGKIRFDDIIKNG
jgi:hypothetical protein